MVISCVLRHAQSRIPALTLIDCGASAYAFIDKTFAQQHNFPQHQLKYPRRLQGFDGQPALTGNITHVVETTMAIDNHIERLFLFVTGLKHYPIVLGHPWLRRHAVDANFGSNTLTMSSPFCLSHCCPSPVKITAVTREEEEFLSPEESQRVWELQDQESQFQTQNLAQSQAFLRVSKNSLTVPAHKEQPQPSVHKEHPVPPSRIEDSPKPSPQLRIEDSLVPQAQEEQPQPSVHKEHPVPPSRIEDSPKPSPQLRIEDSLVPQAQEEQPQHLRSKLPLVNLPEPSLASGRDPGKDTPSRISQALRKGYSPKIKYRSPSSFRPSKERRARQAQNIPIHLDVCEVAAHTYDRLGRQKDAEIFSVTLQEIDRALGIHPPEEIPHPAPMPSLKPPVISPTVSSQERDHRLALFKMEKEIHLANSITEEELELYRQRKNIDPATKLPKQYHEYLDVFSKKEADTLPKHRAYDHAINLKEGSLPPSSRLYGMSRNEMQELRRYLDENLTKGFIRASRSQAASPVLFVKKPGGGLRFCVDYRGLNAITIKNRYPLPLISETLNRLSRAKCFTKLDIISAFNRLRIREGDESLTAFRTRFGLFEYLVMPFGLCNGPASFQHYINDTLGEFLDDFCTAYLDDILIYSEIEAEHEIHVKRILQKLREAGLQVDITKCEFHVNRVPYLGLIITTEGIKMDPAKIETIVQWPSLINVKDVQSFLGFANFYRRFIYGYSRLASPLTRLTRKDVPFVWDAECQAAFETLKKAFTSDVILRHYDPDREIVVETDASDFVSGGILSQYDEQGELHPIAYFSKKHNPAECNYEIYDKELMAIVRAFEEWRPELEGSTLPIKVITDHKNLEYFMSTKQLNRRQARWSEFLSRFDYRIIYRPGKAGGKPDALTRRSGDLPKEGDTSDPRHQYQHQTVLKTHVLDPKIIDLQCRVVHLDRIQLLLSPASPQKPITLAPMDMIPEVQEAEPQLDQAPFDPEEDPLDTPTQTLWDQAQASDQFAPQVLEMLRTGARHHNRIPLAECEERDQALYFRGRKYVPNSDRLRLRIIQLAHDSVPGGHPGRTNCYELVSRAYWWPNLYQYIQRFVRNCHVCTRAKPSRQKQQGWLRPLPIPERRWRDVSMDYVGPLPPSTFMGITYRYILVFVDRLTKMRHLVPTTTMEVEEAANAFYANVWKLHGIPEVFVSDRGTQFTSDVWDLLCKNLKIDAKLSTAYHPQTDGQTERANGVMEHYLRAFVNYMQDDWAKWTPGAEFAANNVPSATTLASPFLANSGQNPRLGFEPLEPLPSGLTAQVRVKLININEFTKKMEEITGHLRDEMLIAQAIYESSANERRRPCSRYLVGDMVWLNAKNLNTARPVVKLDDRNVGPYPVKRVFANPLVIELSLPESMKVHPVFHASLLQHTAQDPLPGQRQESRPPVVAENGERAWYVNSVTNSKYDRRFQPPLLKYYVNWESHVPTWEPFNLVDNCQAAIDEYHSSRPDAPGPHTTPCSIPGCQCRDP